LASIAAWREIGSAGLDGQMSKSTQGPKDFGNTSPEPKTFPPWPIGVDFAEIFGEDCSVDPTIDMERTMQVDLRHVDDVIIVDLEGRMVAGVGERILHDVMNQLVAEGWKKILLNLSGVSWIDSAGIGELVASIKMAKRFGVVVRLLRIGDRVKHVLSISQILPLLEVYEDESAALRDLKEQSEVPPPQ
jgi:anti-anti-sigma factor